MISVHWLFLFLCVFQWYAILLDYVGEYEGTKQRIANAFLVKEHFIVSSALESLIGLQTALSFTEGGLYP